MLKLFGKIILGIIIVIAVSFVILMGVFTQQYLAFQKQKKLPFAEQNVIIYDLSCENIRKHYYDPQFGGNDWNKICLEGRQNAKLAKTNIELAMLIAKNLQIFNVSHQALSLKERVNPLYNKLQDNPYSSPDHVSKYKEEYKDAIDITGIEYSSINIQGKPRSIVTWVYPNTPAFKAGIKPNYPIYIKGSTKEVDTQGHMVFYIYGYILPVEYYDNRVKQSPKGDGQSIPDIKEVQPIKIKLQTNAPLYSKYSNLPQMPPSIIYIKLNSFEQSKDINDIFVKAKTNPKGIILDLRYNGGGKSKYQDILSSLFLPPDTICGYAITRKKSDKAITHKLSHHYDGKLVVLINANSASASEGFSSCIKHYKRGLIIGENSNGSLLVSRNYRIGFWGGQQIPFANYLDANKNPIEGVGVTPDIIVHPTIEGISQGHDEILERAIQEISKN